MEERRDPKNRPAKTQTAYETDVFLKGSASTLRGGPGREDNLDDTRRRRVVAIPVAPSYSPVVDVSRQPVYPRRTNWRRVGVFGGVVVFLTTVGGLIALREFSGGVEAQEGIGGGLGGDSTDAPESIVTGALTPAFDSSPSSSPPPPPTSGSSPEPFTPIPSLPPISATPGQGNGIAVEGEVPLNSFISAEQNRFQVWVDLLRGIVSRGGAAPDGTNALETSLMNPVDFTDVFAPQILTEPGMGFTSDQVNDFKFAFTSMEALDNTRGSDLLNRNGNVWSALFIAQGHNRDYAIFKAAWSILVAQDSDRFGTLTETQVLNNENGALDEISRLKNDILQRIQKRSRFFSKAEKDRRLNRDSDPSNLLRRDLWISDQWESCDTWEPTVGIATRAGQTIQNTRLVVHAANVAEDTHYYANSQNEWIAVAVAIDPTNPNKWIVKAFTDRGHWDRNRQIPQQVNSASGEQMLPCGEGEEAPEQPTPTATAPIVPTPISTVTVVYPSGTPPVAVTLTPTQRVDTPTPGPTLTPRPTRTPGHTPTFQPTMTEQPPLPTVTPLPTSTEAPTPTNSATMTAQPPEPTVTPRSPDPNDYARVVDTTRLKKARNNAGYIFIAPSESRAERKAKSESGKSRRPFGNDNEFVIWDQKRRIKVEMDTYKDRRR